jgi:chemotaxis protein methyltransferase WspC
MISRAVETRMRARGITDVALYNAQLLTEPAEREWLAAELVVPETWFFRGGFPLFDRLAAFLYSRATRTPGATVRVLSIPCSTGEEPYSIAIAVREVLPSPNDCTIDAVDLSERNLARATAGIYPATAFREIGPDIRLSYFRKVEDKWELLPQIRAAVRFHCSNLADPLFLARERPYDLILCRNLFIYLTPDAKQRAIANLDRLLALDGRLCLTPGEADRLPPNRFVPEGSPEFGTYRRVDSGSGIHTALATERTHVAEPAPSAPTHEKPPAIPTLAHARQLADAGALEEAKAACETLLITQPANADAHTLLGVIAIADGRFDAAYQSLRKALYLAPDHREAISHMISVCVHRGDKTQAKALRQKLARLAVPEDE